jgi:lipid-A-disaccharide synthase
MRLAIVAGEASGDLLGAALIKALKRMVPGLQVEGVGGPLMREAGCHCLHDSDELAVMGIVEVFGELPRLLKLRRGLVKRWRDNPPDVVIGVDAPDFNLGLERKLRRKGIKTVHFVSPSVWAWRQKRVHKIGRSTDLVLCLLPFEKAFYDQHGVPAAFVGHPLADEIPLALDRGEHRRRLGLPETGQVVAVLPGSRRGELKRLGEDFAGTINWLASRRPDLVFVSPMAGPAVRQAFEAALAQAAPGVPVTLVDGQPQACMAAADVVLLASGTAALETALVKRPMVMAYRISKITKWLAETFLGLHLKHYSLPNLLHSPPVVPEHIMDAVNPQTLGNEVLGLLEDPARRKEQVEAFEAMHRALRQDAASTAARAVLELLGREPVEQVGE